MNVELCINSGKTQLDEIFGDDTSISHTISLNVDGNTIARIDHTNLEAMYEILNIDESTENFNIDTDRLNYIMVRYSSDNRFEDFKKILRPILRNGVKSINVKRTRAV